MRRPPETRDETLPDVIGPGLEVLFCGINPGASSAAAGHSFTGRSNRFRRVMHLAGHANSRRKRISRSSTTVAA